MGTAIAHGAADDGQVPRPMAMSRQAGVEEGAARFAKEAAAAAEAIGKAEGAERAAELAAQGADIARREHSLGRTPIEDIKRIMSAREFASFGDELWNTVGEAGGLTPEEAKYWLAEGPTTAEIRAAAKAAKAKGGPAPAAMFQRAARAPGEVAISYSELPQNLIGLFLNKINALSPFDNEGRWLRVDKEGISAAAKEQVARLADIVRAEPAVPHDMKLGNGHVLGFFDFSKVSEDMADLFAVETSGGVYVNIGDNVAVTEKRLLDVVHAFLDRAEPRRRSATPPPPPGTVGNLSAITAKADQLAFLKGFIKKGDKPSVRAWEWAPADQLEGRPVLRRVPKKEAASLISDKTRAPLLAKGDVAAYLDANGFSDVADDLRRSGKKIHVDIVDFGQVNAAISANYHSTNIGYAGAIKDRRRLFLNLGNAEASWPDIVANFVKDVLTKS